MADVNSITQETVITYLTALDQELAAKTQQEVQDCFKRYAAETQPEINSMLRALEKHHSECEFPAECIFFFYGLHRFCEERLGFTPAKVSRKQLEDALSAGDAFFAGLEPSGEPWRFAEAMFPEHGIPYFFAMVWNQFLGDLLERGEIDSALAVSLGQFFLIVLKLYRGQFPPEP